MRDARASLLTIQGPRGLRAAQKTDYVDPSYIISFISMKTLSKCITNCFKKKKR
jgi:hypothetical protein